MLTRHKGYKAVEVRGMKFLLVIASLSVVLALAGCGGGSSSGVSRALSPSEPFRVLPPGITFAYTGTAIVNQGGVNRTVPASSSVSIGSPGFTDPRTNTPVLLYTQTVEIDGLESLLYRDFFFSQPENALVAHGSEVLGVATFSFGPALLLPPQLSVGQTFGTLTEPYETLTVTLRNGRVIRSELLAVAGSVIGAFEVDVDREIPFGRSTVRLFHERNWYAPGIAGPVPVKQEIRYAHNGAAATATLELVGLPALP
jgi:hypothetical protein